MHTKIIKREKKQSDLFINELRKAQNANVNKSPQLLGNLRRPLI